MNYEKIYNDLIGRAGNRKLDKNIYRERHHIIPKCLGGQNDKTNLVNLTAKEHYIAHLLLCSIYPDHHGLSYALYIMVKLQNSHQQRYIVSSRTYSRIREASIKLMTDYKRKNPPIGPKNGMYNRAHTIETRHIMSEKARNRIRRPHTKDTIEKIIASNKKSMTDDRRLFCSNLFSGKPKSEQQKLNQSLAMKGKYTGKTRTAETKQIMSEKKLGDLNPAAKKLKDIRSGLIYGSCKACKVALNLTDCKMDKLRKSEILINWVA